MFRNKHDYLMWTNKDNAFLGNVYMIFIILDFRKVEIIILHNFFQMSKLETICQGFLKFSHHAELQQVFVLR